LACSEYISTTFLGAMSCFMLFVVYWDDYLSYQMIIINKTKVARCCVMIVLTD